VCAAATVVWNCANRLCYDEVSLQHCLAQHSCCVSFVMILVSELTIPGMLYVTGDNENIIMTPMLTCKLSAGISNLPAWHRIAEGSLNVILQTVSGNEFLSMVRVKAWHFFHSRWHWGHVTNSILVKMSVINCQVNSWRFFSSPQR